MKFFQFLDETGEGNIGFQSFKRAINDYRLKFNESDIKLLFNAFDVNKSNTVDYEEFMRIVKVYICFKNGNREK